MKHVNATFLLIASSLLSVNLHSQTADRFWSPVSETNIRQTGVRQIIPQKYITVQLNGSAVKDRLFSAPNETGVKITESPCILSLPVPDGTMQRFYVVESPIMADALGAAFPDMKTFSVRGIDDPYANGKLDWTELGFHAMIRSANKADFFIDPYCVGNNNDYISYYTSDFRKDPKHTAPEIGLMARNLQTGEQEEETGTGARAANSTPAVCVGNQLRIYRLALTCTGEYAIAATGFPSPTVPQTLAKIVTSINRVDGVYETEVSVRLVLVPTQTAVIFTVPGTDPYTANNNGLALLGQCHTLLSNTIGLANFDIGHIFSTGGGGIANLGCVCSNADKGRGVTGSANPVGDPYDIDYVAHEMGHQFEGNHTFNAITGSCNGNRNGPTSAEPGSGITIMGYAGICNAVNNLAPNSIAYFHAMSYDEIVNFTNSGSGSGCPTVSNTVNQPPFVTGSGDYIIPKSTPFFLTGSAVDPDGDPVTYSWEETDPGASGGNWSSGNKPYFRSYAPSVSPTRYFPNQTVVLSGNYTGTRGEYLPSTPQALQFRLTGRDNKMGGGGVCYAMNTITIDNSGPLTVTLPSTTGIVWYSGTQQTVTWDVNGTDLAPVFCGSVNILISTNSGSTYTMLVANTPNDGVQLVTSPTVAANITTCRIKVESAGNIFYDISNNNFTISTNTVFVGLSPVSQNNPVALNVWPNPANSQLNIAAVNLNSQSATQLTITDVLGKVVLQSSYANKSELKETLDLSGFSKGFYFVKVMNDDKQAVYRIVKD